jgi:hypothetical protein
MKEQLQRHTECSLAKWVCAKHFPHATKIPDRALNGMHCTSCKVLHTMGWNFSDELNGFIFPGIAKIPFFCSGVLLERDSAISRAPRKVTSHFHSTGMGGGGK